MKRSQRRARQLPVPPTAQDISACSRKRRFVNKAWAKRAADRARREGGHATVYTCPACGCWHVTGADQALERERRRA